MPTSELVRPGRDLLVLSLLAVLFFGAGVGWRDLWNPNEGTYGRAVVEMAEDGEWLIPTLNEEAFAEKPILYYWTALATAALLGGVSELTLRLPQVLLGVTGTLFVFLLVGDYLGRRRAWLAALLFATQYLVWWTARTIQMDSFVLVSTLVTTWALTGGLDRDWSPRSSWLGAGLATGLGFAAKGPVAVLLPALVLGGYCAVSRRWPGAMLRPRAIAGGLVVFAASGLPWYAFLLVTGQMEVLEEMLVRQNLRRFVEAWDHVQPWWYYLEYFWVDYAPWSWLVPIAAGLRPESDREAAAHRLAWAWIAAIVLFFSLADSKRAPYVLPIAPAVAVLASAVVDRLVTGRLVGRRRLAALAVHGLFGGLLLAAGIYLLAVPLGSELPSALNQTGTAIPLAVLGAAVLAAVAWRPRPWAAPAMLATAMVGLCLLAALYVLPAFDEIKSHRGFATRLPTAIGLDRTIAAHFGIFKWVRGGYPYYLGRPVPHLDTTAEVERYWNESRAPCLLLEEPEFSQLVERLPGAEVVLERRIGSETARLVCRSGRALSERTGLE